MARRLLKGLIRVGVVGIGRGYGFARAATEKLGMELVALCDVREQALAAAGREMGVATYTDYDKFLEHDMDAVILANYFHEHAPFAIKALAAGKHVMSETIPAFTLAEAVQLVNAVEKSKRIYMFAENYPYTAFSLELARLYKAGEIGRVLYAEGEYNHPGSFPWHMGIAPGLRHWRNNLPATYYCTHAMAPLMVATDTMPKRVNGFVARLPLDSKRPRLWKQQDMAGIIMAVMDNDAVFKLLQTGLPGHSIFYRLHGERGLMETGRGPGYWGPGNVRIVHEDYDCHPGEPTERSYYPGFPAWAEAAMRAGHGGGDWFTNHYFAEAIRTGKQPYLNVYRGVAMSVIGILAWKSVLANGASFDVPDFRREAARRAVENDTWRPLDLDNPDAPPVNSRGRRQVIPAALNQARRIWKDMGFREEP